MHSLFRQQRYKGIRQPEFSPSAIRHSAISPQAGGYALCAGCAMLLMPQPPTVGVFNDNKGHTAAECNALYNPH